MPYRVSPIFLSLLVEGANSILEQLAFFNPLIGKLARADLLLANIVYA